MVLRKPAVKGHFTRKPRSVPVTTNPYEPPVAPPEESDEVRRARRWVSAPALGIGISGAVYVAFGILFIGMSIYGGVIVVYRTLRADADLDSIPRDMIVAFGGFFLMGVVAITVGGLAVRYARRLYRLDSDRGAHVACILGLIMYPLCMITLPLGIYGLIVLRRQDIRAVLKQRESQYRDQELNSRGG
jgi:hypothetical protein